MTVFHYGGSWLYIDEPISDEKENSYELSLKEWEIMTVLDIPSFKTVLAVKKETKGQIKTNER